MQQRDLDGAHVLRKTHQSGRFFFFVRMTCVFRNKLSLETIKCVRVFVRILKKLKLRVMRSIDRRIFLPTRENVSLSFFLSLSLSHSTYSFLHNRVDGDDGDDGWLLSELFFFALKKVGFFAARSR